MTWLARLRRRSRREAVAGVLVVLGLTAFVLLAYVVIVLGGGLLTRGTASPAVALSVVATAVVALFFDRVQSWLGATATRLVHQGRPSPYEVLQRFSETLATPTPDAELPARMAQVLAEGTGAQWAQVWVLVGGQRTLAATWPENVSATADPRDDADLLKDHSTPGHRSMTVSQGGEPLGVLVVQERADVPLTAVERRLFAGLASQAGLVLRAVQLRAQLELRLVELSARERELRGSRQRLVDVQDHERRRLERDIHDGAQQHLVALAVNLRLADVLSQNASQRSAELLGGQQEAVGDAIRTVVELARGIYPALLGEQGLVAALAGTLGGTSAGVTLVSGDVRRYPPELEAAAYFCSLEAVQNASKHAGATGIRVTVGGDAQTLTVAVEDDGVGFDPASAPRGTGMANMRDRVESAGGTLAAVSAPSCGTRVTARFPVPLAPTARAQADGLGA
jgi:signal transduction histidine kinase